MSGAQHLLDQVQTPARVEALAATPEAYTRLVEEALGTDATLAGLAARDDQLRLALAHLDVFSERVARIHFDRALADDRSIPPATRRVFAGTIVSYAARVELLEQRARDVAARGGSFNPSDVAARIADGAQATLALRAALRAPLLALIQRLAAAAVPDADRQARDRELDDATRMRWSAVRRDLETLATQPESISAAPMAARTAAWPAQLDEPAAQPEVSPADLIEMD